MTRLAVPCLLILGPMLLALPAMAATVIDIKARGMETRLLMNDEYARVDNSKDGSYLLLHRPSEESYLVLPKTRQVLKLDEDSNYAESLKVELIALQPTAQKMFGYPVRRYRIMANRKYCGDVFASRDAMSDLEVAPMLGAASEMIEQQLNAMGPFIDVMDNCTQASMTILSHADKIGMPLRMVDDRGRLLSDVVNIDTSATLANNDLTFPADYEEVGSTRELDSLGQRVRQVRELAPQAVERLNQFGRDIRDRYDHYWQR